MAPIIVNPRATSTTGNEKTSIPHMKRGITDASFAC